MSQNWSEMAKLQKKPLTNISNITILWKNIIKLCKRCFEHNQKCEELMKPERKMRCPLTKMMQKMKVSTLLVKLRQLHMMSTIWTLTLLTFQNMLNEDQRRIFDQVSLITSLDTKLPPASAKTLSLSTCLSVEWDELENYF